MLTCILDALVMFRHICIRSHSNSIHVCMQGRTVDPTVSVFESNW
jgi:hypothetical protein